MKYCINIKQSKAKQSKAKPKIVSLINNSFKIVLLILLFSISCKSKQKPEEKYNGIIPQGFSGKYIYGNNNRDNYFETTSSNAIIGSPKAIRQGVLPLVLVGTNDYWDSINGKEITYRDLVEYSGYRYSFYTNKNSKRTLNVWNPASLWNGYIHADDINK
ncbi:hypothetical protein EPJ69_06030 [Brachyspira aalborgi]|uniref:Uncharacterized protein n=1 Tax=Brachyspira aalborgi TaxID=29522 RepID=A0A5C8E4Z4_9SPIR|nr:hypothetical protein [Brachyspira aalborgi]TXJ32414.1 hypothetical protein EPJ69_06030 [Brachyspira aalborgi]